MNMSNKMPMMGVTHTIVFRLKGHSEDNSYTVSEEEWNRLHNVFQNGDKPFACFDTDDLSVAVNTKEMLWVRLLFDVGVIEKDTLEIEDDFGLQVWFKGSEIPTRFGIDWDSVAPSESCEMGEMQGLMYELDIDDGEVFDSRFITFTDEDGEVACLNRKKISLIECDLRATDEKAREEQMKKYEAET